jgi:hypothetical protein
MLSGGRQCDGPFPDEEVGPTTLTGAIPARTPRPVVSGHSAWGKRAELGSPILRRGASVRVGVFPPLLSGGARTTLTDTTSDEGEHIKTVFAHFGRAYDMANVFETGLAIAICSLSS